MRAGIAAGLFGLVLSAAACGGDDSGAGNQDEFISQVCAEFAGCCQTAGLRADGAQCRALYGASGSAGGYDQAAATACLQEVRALGESKCDFVASATPSCSRVFAAGGRAQPGEACEDEGDCAPSSEGQVTCASDFVNDATVRQCQVRLPGVVGSTPCVGTVQGSITFSLGNDGLPPKGYLCDTADGLLCDSQSGACRALGALGETCSGGSYSCILSAYCDLASGTCKARAALGAACQVDAECQDAAYCEPSSKICAAQRAPGATCALDSECDYGNCTNQKCGPSDDLALVFLCGSN